MFNTISRQMIISYSRQISQLALLLFVPLLSTSVYAQQSPEQTEELPSQVAPLPTTTEVTPSQSERLPITKPPAARASKTPEETEYTLGAGDRVKVDIFLVPEYSGEYQILVDGTVNLPLVGNVDVNGMTLGQMGEALNQKYAEYLKRPIVTVSLVLPRPLKIAIAGEVNSPGAYTITLQPGQKFPTVTDIVQLAGGLTGAADVKNVEIRRSLGDKKNFYSVNLWELIQQGNIGQDISLRDGDVIVIPTNNNIDLAENRQLADANFGIKATDILNVAVIGEVNRPGSHQIRKEQNISTQEPPRVTQAIQVAGGIKPLADVRNIQVRRLTRSGQEQVIDVDLWALLETGDINNDLILQEGDTIVVPEATELKPEEAESLATASFAPAVIRVNVVGEVKRPGPVDVPSNTPLNQAILAAGGFDEKRAETEVVELIRVNPNGTVTKREIDIDLAKGIDEENNPALRNNDVIVVNRSGLASVTDTVGTIFSPVGTVFSIFRLF